MEMKKCISCGSFISSEATVCASCANKLNYEHTVLENYFGENVNYDSIPAISEATGISPSSIQNYMKENNFDDISTDIDFKDYYTKIPY